MTARMLKQTHGRALLGRRIVTEKIGEWPGGIASITVIDPDPKAPEVVFLVVHTEAKDPVTKGPWEMGIFEDEQVQLVSQLIQ